MHRKNLDNVAKKLQSGDLIDVSALNKEKNQAQMSLNYVDLYVKTIALKYPLIFPNQKQQGMKTLDKLHMMKRMV